MMIMMIVMIVMMMMFRNTVELPCVTADVFNVYTDTHITLQGRALSVEWVESPRDTGRHVPAIHVPHCRPDLTCLQMSYIDCDSDCDAGEQQTSTTTTAPTARDEHCCNKVSRWRISWMVYFTMGY